MTWNGAANQGEGEAMKTTWKQTCEAAATDPTLRQLAAAVREANRAGTPDRDAYRAFKDRCLDLGLSVPNDAYWNFLLWAVLVAVDGQAAG